MKQKKWYIGREKANNKRELLCIEVNEATESKYGEKYGYLVGPFRTKRGASFMLNNPMIQTVSEAERLSKNS